MSTSPPQDAMDRVFRLEGVSLFAGLSTQELLPVAEIAAAERFEAGATIFAEGDAGDRLYVITDGQVEVRRGTRRLATLGEGECFGEMALLDRSPRSASVVAVDATGVLAVGRADFRELMRLYPRLARALAGVLAGRIRGALSAEAGVGDAS